MRRALMLLAVAACSDDLPATLPELNEVAVKARDEAAAARGRKDAGAALAAADRAAAALKAAEALPDGPEVGEIRLASRAAGLTAVLAEQERDRDAAIGTLKAKAYRAARSAALTGLFKGLSLAADQAAQGKLETLPETVRASALEAARISGRPPNSDGTVDWPGVAADLSAMAAAPPPAIGFWLAVGYALGHQHDLALVEMEMLDPAALPEDKRVPLTIARHFVYSSKGWTALAADRLGAFEPQAQGTPEMIALVHAYLAYAHFKEKQYERADSEIAKTMLLWPNNPVAVYLTGERLAADGKIEQAAESLEKSLAGTENQWIAERLSKRARELRDGKTDGQALVYEPAFLTEVALHLLAQAAKRSPQGQEALAWVEWARGLGRRLLK